VDTPEKLYYEPASEFVAAFVTQANALKAQWHEGGWNTEIGWFAAPSDQDTHAQQGIAMILQEGIRMKTDASSAIEICDRQFLGREYRYCLRTPDGATLYVRSSVHQPLEVGSAVQLSIEPNTVRIFRDLPPYLTEDVSG
jgi:iron(III) transport system ATP-binding protein